MDLLIVTDGLGAAVIGWTLTAEVKSTTACLETLVWPTGCDRVVAVRGVSLPRYGRAGPRDPDL